MVIIHVAKVTGLVNKKMTYNIFNYYLLIHWNKLGNNTLSDTQLAEEGEGP